MSRDAKIETNLIMVRIQELYDLAYEDGRKELMEVLAFAIQEKDSQGDEVALAVLVWLRERMVNNLRSDFLS
jgi:hypothetical protein